MQFQGKGYNWWPFSYFRLMYHTLLYIRVGNASIFGWELHKNHQIIAIFAIKHTIYCKYVCNYIEVLSLDTFYVSTPFDKKTRVINKYMALNTKNNPGCYHSMISYLAQINNVSQWAIDTVYRIRDLYWRPDAKKAKHRRLRYKSYDITVVDKNGSFHPFIENGRRFDDTARNVDVMFFACKRLRRVADFDIKPTKIGKYNDSLPGGWYQKVDLWQINDQFFAEMDCTC